MRDIYMQPWTERVIRYSVSLGKRWELGFNSLQWERQYRGCYLMAGWEECIRMGALLAESESAITMIPTRCFVSKAGIARQMTHQPIYGNYHG